MSEEEFNAQYYLLPEADKLAISQQASKIFNLPTQEERKRALAAIDPIYRPFVDYTARRAYKGLMDERQGTLERMARR